MTVPPLAADGPDEPRAARRSRAPVVAALTVLAAVTAAWLALSESAAPGANTGAEQAKVLFPVFVLCAVANAVAAFVASRRR